MDPRVKVEELPEEIRCGRTNCRCVVIKITDEQGNATISH